LSPAERDAAMPFDPAFDDDSDPNNWTVPPATAGISTTAGASTTAGSPAPWSDAWERFWSLFPASAAGAQAWRAPIFPNASLFGPIGRARVPAWASTSPYLPAALPTSTAVASPVSDWSPSHSLLGALAQLPSPATPSGGNSNGLPSSPAWDGSLLAPLAQLSPAAISPHDNSSGPTSSPTSGISPSLSLLEALARYSPPVLPNANSIGRALIPPAANASDYDDQALREALKLSVVDFEGSTSPTAGDPNPYARSDWDSTAGANYGPVSPGLDTPSPPGLDARCCHDLSTQSIHSARRRPPRTKDLPPKFSGPWRRHWLMKPPRKGSPRRGTSWASTRLPSRIYSMRHKAGHPQPSSASFLNYRGWSAHRVTKRTTLLQASSSLLRMQEKYFKSSKLISMTQPMGFF
jgi:hypothetical protein